MTAPLSMSATDILNELPKLKREERRAIASRIFELEENRRIDVGS